jgi:hypothetical protein
VAHLNLATLDSGPRNTVHVGGTLDFSADDGKNGMELSAHLEQPDVAACTGSATRRERRSEK